ncbi:metal-dependent hydrolase [gamma proteobacterium HTCC5015]|nr:metal-dependent hydrolase [gamma proteobacterium HTCC5015]
MNTVARKRRNTQPEKRTRTASPRKKLSSAQVGIPARPITFPKPQNADRYFALNNNPATTLMFASFSGIFPPGEQFFVESVRRYRHQISDERLKAAVSGFIGQESLHSREHDRLNDHFKAQDMDTDLPEQLVKIALTTLGKFPPRLQLACTCFMEHTTAGLAEQWLTNREFQTTSDPDMLNLWYWHALEELEHKSVAFDVWRSVGGRDYELKLAMMLVISTVWVAWLTGWGVLMARDKQLLNWRENARGLWFMFKPRGFLTGIAATLWPLLQKGFHPSQQDTSELENQWREKLFGSGGHIEDLYAG